MRVIKFRGKTESGNWVYGNLSILNKGISDFISAGTYISNSAGSPFAYAVNPDTVGQFTGLLDKNGKEIYEGDIITVNGKYPKLVRFIDEYACFCLANLGDLNREWMQPWQQVSLGWWNDFSREILMTGNEFDNPELLKGGEE